MCRRYILASKLDTIESRFGVRASFPDGWDPSIVVVPGDQTLIITRQNPGDLILSEFGMTPSWAKSKMQLINARAEGDKNPGNDPSFSGSRAIFLKPAFQKPLFSQRCIVVADAYIECSSGILPKPYLFYLREHRHPIGFAGLFDIWKNPENGALLHSFTIITVPANSLVRGMPFSRMPVILPFGRESRWLKPTLSLAEILGMLTKYPSKLMNAYPLSGKILQSGPFSKEILLPAGQKLLSETLPAPLPQRSYFEHKKRT
ncbi:MAG: yoaM [Bacteroidetes bacterium]|nr:MAG: yoaM [Bacteroidota bacterium]